MKLFIATALGLLVSLSANANPPETEPPIRMARLTGKVMKYISMGPGKTPKGELVCQINAEIPVYGPWIKGQTKGRALKNAVNCDAVLRKRNVNFAIMSDLSLTEAKDGKPEGKRLSILMAFFKNEKRGQVVRGESLEASGDRNAVRLGLSYAIPRYIAVDTKEYLSISAEVEDLNQ